jgi:hypothetical protein
MKQPRSGVFVILLALALGAPRSAQGQEQLAWFGDVTLGPVFPDQQRNDFKSGHGFVFQARLGRHLGPTLSAIVELTHASFGGPEAFLTSGTALAVVPCDPADPFCGTGSSPSFPVRMLVTGAGLEAATGDQTAKLFGSLAPGLYWLYDRAPGTRALSGGVGVSVGGAVRIADPIWAVVDVHYHRLFSEGQNPRWVLPLSFGLQVR